MEPRRYRKDIENFEGSITFASEGAGPSDSRPNDLRTPKKISTISGLYLTHRFGKPKLLNREKSPRYLTENVASPFQAEPKHLSKRGLRGTHVAVDSFLFGNVSDLGSV
jgi:hypothetical protein